MNAVEAVSPELDSGLSRKFLIGTFGFLTIASLVPIWIGEYFPSQNGPEYLLAVQMMKEYFNPIFNYSDYYELIFVLTPNLLFHVVVYLLYSVFPILISSKIALSLNVILLPLGIFYLIKTIHPKKVIFGFGGFPFIYNYFIPKGYNSFYFSIVIFCFFFGYLVKHSDRLHTKNLVWLAILVFLVYMSHVFSFVLAIFIATVYILLRYQSYRAVLKVLAVFIPSCIFFAQYVIFMLNQSDSLVDSHAYWIRYYPWYYAIKLFVKMSMSSFSELPAFIFLIPLSFILYAVFKKVLGLRSSFSVSDIARGGWRLFMKQETTLCLFIILSLIFFALPGQIAGWPKFNIRLLPFVFILMLACAVPFSKKISNRMFLGVVCVTSLLLYMIMAFHVVKINKDLKDYTSGIPVIEKNKTLLPVRLEDYRVGEIRPLHWAFNYYNLFKGGATGQSVVHYTGRVPMKYRRPIEQAFPNFAPNLKKGVNMIKIREAYDYVLFWGENKEILGLFERFGFQLIHEQGKLRLYSNNLG